jgi:hypothetical protein
MWTESKRPQLNLAELHQLRWLLGTLLAALSAWTVPAMGINAWVWLVPITLAAPVMLWRPAWNTRLPGWAHRLAFPVMLALTAADCRLETQRVLPALVRLTLMLLLYRMITARKRRDDLQVIVLGLFLVVVAGVLTVSVVFVLQILAFTACALLFLLTITLADSAGGAAEPPADWTRLSWPALARRVRAVANWHVVLLGGGLFAGLVALSSVVFIFLPRFEFENNLFLNRLMPGTSRSGFSETVSLDAVTDITNDTSIAFNVDVSNRAQVPGQLYWRMLVLDDYFAPGQFRISQALMNTLRLAPEEKATRVLGTAKMRIGAPVWTVYFEPGTSKYLPLPGQFGQVIFAEAQEQLKFNVELGVVALPHSPVKMLAYQLDELDLATPFSGPGGGSGASGLAPKQPGAPDYLDLQLIEAAGEKPLLEKAVAEAGAAAGTTPEEFARRATGWLWGRHAYSLQADNTGIKGAPQDPLVRWLSGTQAGHCEYFAGSFVLLARAAGFPARLVVGFKGGSWNPHSENLVVRNSNAHAWAEIYDTAKKEWLRVDPTPGADILAGLSAGPQGESALKAMTDSRFSARFDSLRVFWYRRIVSFDQDSQVRIAAVAQRTLEGLGRGLKAWLREERAKLLRWLAQPWSWRRLVTGAGVVVLLFAVARWWRAGRLAWLRHRGADPIRREAGRWLARLPAHGAAEAAVVRGQLERLRYGAAVTWPDPATVFRAARRARRAEARGQ